MKKKEDQLKKIKSMAIKKGIIASIIAAIIFMYFLNPILSFAGKQFISLGKSIFSSYVDRMFEEMAVGRTNYSFLLYMIFTLLFFFSLLNLLIIIIRRFINKGNSKEKSTKDEKKLGNLGKEKKRIQVKLLVIIILLIMLSGLMVIDGYIREKTITSFNQHIRIISPYISQNQKDVIISEFSSMRSYDDYINLYKKIIEICKEKKIYLPKNKLHPL